MTRRARIACVGTGWIGRLRLQRLLEQDAAEVVALVEPNEAELEKASALEPRAARLQRLESLWELGLDGVAIATPSALHAAQAVEALAHGLAVFCQKPLGLTAAETLGVVDAARRADRLLGVDFSYRHLRGLDLLHRWVQGGELGELFALDLSFHNAYGPDKEWYYDRARSGGGCLLDLGIHLVDLALWLLDFEPVAVRDGRCYAGGRPLGQEAEAVEDYAVARLETGRGASIRLACSWRLHAGADCLVEVWVHGSAGGARLHNVNGSFFDFELERLQGTSRQIVAGPPDSWGGRALVAWAGQLAQSPRYQDEVRHAVTVAEVLEAIYRMAPASGRAPGLSLVPPTVGP